MRKPEIKTKETEDETPYGAAKTGAPEPAVETTAPDEASPPAPEPRTEGEADAAATEPDPVAAIESDLQKWRELALRTAADLENYRKRMARDKQEAVRYANQSLIEELLPVLDNFEMGMEAAAAEKGSMIHRGLEMVQRQFADLLAAHGIALIEARPGGKFDPMLHEAMAQEPHAAVEAGRIVRVIRRGFRMHDRLLRPAMVAVSSGGGDDPPSSQD